MVDGVEEGGEERGAACATWGGGDVVVEELRGGSEGRVVESGVGLDQCCYADGLVDPVLRRDAVWQGIAEKVLVREVVVSGGSEALVGVVRVEEGLG